MRRRLWIWLAVIAAAFVGLLVYGALTGDAGLVSQNAGNTCFS